MDRNTPNLESNVTLSKKVRVLIEIYGGKGWRSNRDIDNCSKAILDLLVRSKVILEDNCKVIVDVRITYTEPQTKKSEAYVKLEVEGTVDEEAD